MRDERIKEELKILGSTIGDIPPIDRQMPSNEYFNNLADIVIQEVKYKEQEERDDLKEYFEQLSNQVLKQVTPTKRYTLPFILGIASSIALLIIAFGHISIPTSTTEYAFKTELSEDELMYALEEYYTLDEIAYLDEDEDSLDDFDEEDAIYLDYLEDYDLQELNTELD